MADKKESTSTGEVKSSKAKISSKFNLKFGNVNFKYYNLIQDLPYRYLE